MSKLIRGNPLLEKNKGKGQPIATPKGMNWSAFEAELEKRMKEKGRVRNAPDSRGELVDSRHSRVNYSSPRKTPLIKGEVVSPKSKSSKSSSRRETTSSQSPAVHEERHDIEKLQRKEKESASHQEKSSYKREAESTTRRSADPSKETPRGSRGLSSSCYKEQNVKGGTKREDKRSSGDCNTKADEQECIQKKGTRSNQETLSPEKYHGKFGFNSSSRTPSSTQSVTVEMSKKRQEDKLTETTAKENGLFVDCENYHPEISALSVVNEHKKDVSSTPTLGVIDASEKTSRSISDSTKKPNIKGKLKWLKNRLSKDSPISNATATNSDKSFVELTTPTPRYQAHSPSKYYAETSSEQLQRWVKALNRAIKDAKTTKHSVLETKPSEESGIFETPHKLDDGMTDCQTQTTEYETHVSDKEDRHRSQFMTVRSVEYDVMSATYDEMDIESVSSLEILYNWLTCRDEPEIAPRHLRKHGPVVSSEDW
jgi:hypothetical protein